MARKFDKKQMKKDLLERKKKGEERSSGSFRTFLKIPKDIDYTFWNPKARDGGEDKTIDILPYQAGAFDPLMEKGQWTHCLDVYVHKSIGAANDQFVCPQQNYGKPCPICEKRAKLYEDGDDELAKKLYPSRRTVYNIISYEPESDEDKGVMIFEVAYTYLEDPIQELAAKAE